MAKGILLGNLGSPNSYSNRDVKKYLHQFLMDRFVLNIPYLFRWVLVYLIIVPFRHKKSAEAYKSIWTEEGSPLSVYTKKQAQKLEEILGIPVIVGMRYGKPSIKKAIQELKNKNVDDILVFPLYPQFAMSSYETFYEKVIRKLYKEHITKYKIAPVFYDNKYYLESLTLNIKQHLKKVDLVVFSFHGLPENHIYESDLFGNCKINNDCCSTITQSTKTCYRAQSYYIANTVAQNLGLSKNEYIVSFQSRLGKQPWLKPFTDLLINDLPSKGIKNIAVVCPSFVSDCLETLEEINIRAKESFIQNGGTSLTLIPCLNDNKDWIHNLAKLIKEQV